MAEHKHNHKDFEDLLKSLKTKKTDDLDDFEREALEGFEALGSEEDAISAKNELDEKIRSELFTEEKRRRPVVYWFAAAGLLLVIGLSVLFVRNNKEINNSDVAAVEQKEIKDLEKEAALSAPLEETVATNAPLRSDVKNEGAKTPEVEGKTSLSEPKKENDQIVAGFKSNAVNSRSLQGSGNGNVILPTEDGTFATGKKDENKKISEEVAKTQFEANDEEDKNSAVVDDSKYKKEEMEKYRETTTKTTTDKMVVADNRTDERTEGQKDSKGKLKDRAIRKKSKETSAADENIALAEKSPVNTSPATATENKQETDKDNKANYDAKTLPAASPEKKASEMSPTLNGVAATGATTYYWNATENTCYYSGGKEQLQKDISQKLTEKNANKQFDVLLTINDKKKVEKVFYLNVYDLTKEEQIKVTEVLKSLSNFNFSGKPAKKSLSEYKLEYRP
jgi:hypothetical protein